MDAERKLATVVFADLTGSTELAAAQDPERTRAMLERFYDAMAQEIAAAGGTIEKFAGDAVMAAFGVPVAHEDHVERALHAALAMQRRLDELFDGKLTLRVGVNCGEVVVGEAREGSSFVTGDAVNVAARLEQLAEPGEILVGERAAAIVSGAFEFEAPQTLQAKGKPEGVACRRLVRALSLMRPRGVPGLRSPFVGRDGELAAVQRAYERCASVREAQLVTVMGEAGVGKSRLVRELWQWLGRSAPGSLRRVGRCPPYGHAVTYQPLAEIVKEHFGILDSDPPERILALLGEREILAIALGLDVAGDLHPVVARDRLHDAWVDLVQTLASERPLVMLVEDLHWAEEPLLELLERMLRDVPGPVLLVGTARPEFLDRSPTWGRGRVPSEWIWLEALQPDDVRRLLEQAAEAEVPPTVQEFLGQAEGNPLFLEELVSKLIEGGALRPGEGWNPVLVPEDGGVPESVQSVLASRIDLLPPAEKRALQAAAVIGRVFWSGALGRLLGGVDPNLRLLEQRDFIRRRGASSLEGEREFAFKHAITREVGYRSLTLGDRARLHAEFALWLLGRGGGRDEDAALLALHYGEAARPENADLAWGDDPMQLQELRSYALSWLRRAAELARGRYEAAEALVLLTQALAYAEDDTTRIELQREIAYTHSFRYDPEGLRAALESALELGPDPAITAEIYGQLAYYALVRPYMWKQPPSRELGESWLAKAFDLSSEGSEARAYALLARAFSQPGRVNEAKEAYAIGEALGQPRLNALACEAQMLAATAAGHYTEACRVGGAVARRRHAHGRSWLPRVSVLERDLCLLAGGPHRRRPPACRRSRSSDRLSDPARPGSRGGGARARRKHFGELAGRRRVWLSAPKRRQRPTRAFRVSSTGEISSSVRTASPGPAQQIVSVVSKSWDERARMSQARPNASRHCSGWRFSAARSTNVVVFSRRCRRVATRSGSTQPPPGSTPSSRWARAAAWRRKPRRISTRRAIRVRSRCARSVPSARTSR